MRSKRRDVDLLTALDELLSHYNKQYEQSQTGENGIVKLINAIKETDILDYDKLYALVRSNATEIKLRKQAIRMIGLLASGIIQTNPDTYSRKRIIYIDRRTAFSALRTALNTDDKELQALVIWKLGILGHRGAVPILGEILLNKSEEKSLRLNALIALSCIYDDSRIKGIYETIAYDETEPNTELRGDVIEQLGQITRDEADINRFVTLLNHNSDTIRFWTAYGLVFLTEYCNLSKYLTIIDKVVAYDSVIHQTAPYGFWWHINRELAPALEHIYAQKLLPKSYGEFSRPYTMLISPQLEYWDFRQAKQAGKPISRTDLKYCP